MVRTKFSARKTSGPSPVKEEPPKKSVKVSAENGSEASKSVPVDKVAIVLDNEKVQEATKLLPKIPKRLKNVKKEPTEESEVTAVENAGMIENVSNCHSFKQAELIADKRIFHWFYRKSFQIRSKI